jgi:hypothetical protein
MDMRVSNEWHGAKDSGISDFQRLEIFGGAISNHWKKERGFYRGAFPAAVRAACGLISPR